MDIKEFIKKHRVTEEEKLEGLKKEFQGRNFKIKMWKPPRSNPNWSHDHCRICNQGISNLKDAENVAYGDEKDFDWICKSCFEKYKKRLNLLSHIK